MPSRSVRTWSQSSIRPIISVTTGPMRRSVRRPPRVARAPARSRLPPRGPAATVKQTVTLTLMPAAVASSIAASPAAVAGNLTMTFGASDTNPAACASIRSAEPNSVGSVCIESRPLRPPVASKTGSSKRAPADGHLADDRPGELDLGPIPMLLASSSTRPCHVSGDARQTSVTIVGLAVAPVAPKLIAYSSSSTAHESFQMSVGVVAIVRPSGLSASGNRATASSERKRVSSAFIRRAARA